MNRDEINHKLDDAGHDWAERYERDCAVQAMRKAEAERRERSLQAFLLVVLGILSWALVWLVYQVAVSL